MPRKCVETVSEAQSELDSKRARPLAYEDSQHSLPLNNLNWGEFEILTFMVLKAERPESHVVYYGKTNDGGRDIVSRLERELIQCKRYAASVDASVIAPDIAKIYANVFDKLIDPAPLIVSFYVTTDLTAGATDLLEKPSKWEAVCEAALTKHLERAPSSALLEFARKWRPEFRVVRGSEFSLRALKQVDIVNEFFTVRTISTGDIRPLELEVRRLTGALDAGGAAMVQGLLAIAEAKNPGLAFSAETTATGTIVTISAKAGSTPNVSRLGFPNTEAGRIGAQKFESAMNEGLPLSLTGEECTWTPAYQHPFHPGLEFSKSGTIKISTPQFPATFPARVDCFVDGKNEASLNFVNLVLVRVGLKYVTFRMEKGELCGAISLRLDKTRGKINVGIEDWEGGAPTAQLRKTLVLGKALSQGAKVILSSPVDGQRYIGFDAGIDARFARTSDEMLELVDEVETISSKLSVDLRMPAQVSVEDVRLIQLLATGIKQGHADISSEPCQASVSVSREGIEQLLSIWSAGARRLMIVEKAEQFELFGKALPPVITKTFFQDAFPTKSLQEILDGTMNATSESVSFEIDCARIAVGFPEWGG